MPPQTVRLGEALPFPVRDSGGRVLLGAGLAVTTAAELNALSRVQLFGEELEAVDWQRRQRIDSAWRESVLSLPDEWHDLVGQLDSALLALRRGDDWRARLFAVHSRARQLYQRRPDGSLYHLVYEAGHSTQRYSCQHALLSLLMGEEAATKLGWSQPWIDSLGRAALTMNVAMAVLQDELAGSNVPPTAEMRAEIDGHPQASAQLLEAGNLADPLCVAVVRLHHDTGLSSEPLAELPPERQLARLLRRVDIFAAKISRRAMRAPMSPVQAAREACLGTGGVPDEIGGALLKAVGLYPPGSFVKLTSGELAIVLARGARANLPVVAALVSATGATLLDPPLRDTLDRRYTVTSALTSAAVKVRPPHEVLLAMR